MGITGLWTALGDGKHMYLADFSTRFYEQHGRYPRIAVDEIGWWFINISQKQLANILIRQPAAHTYEKTNLFRAMKLAKWHIEPIFIFDGPGRPQKRNGSGGGWIDPQRRQLIKNTLTTFGIPWYEAPGEAEAECAALQRQGIVDAVWTEDSDAFMFGATCVLRPLKERETQLVEDKVRVYHMDEIQQQLDLDQTSMLLFAVLAGGDYHTAGLPRCGLKAATKLAARSTGLAHGLLSATASTIQAWRDDLARQSGLTVPQDFPNMAALRDYRRPKIATDKQRAKYDVGQGKWYGDIETQHLARSMALFFNQAAHLYYNRIPPYLLGRSLASLSEQQLTALVIQHGIRGKRANSNPSEKARSEIKLEFDAFTLGKVDDTIASCGLEKESKVPPGATSYPVECVILACHKFKAVLDRYPKRPKKRPADAASDNRAQQTTTSTVVTSTTAQSLPAKKQKVNGLAKTTLEHTRKGMLRAGLSQHHTSATAPAKFRVPEMSGLLSPVPHKTAAQASHPGKENLQPSLMISHTTRVNPTSVANLKAKRLLAIAKAPSGTATSPLIID